MSEPDFPQLSNNETERNRSVSDVFQPASNDKELTSETISDISDMPSPDFEIPSEKEISDRKMSKTKLKKAVIVVIALIFLVVILLLAFGAGGRGNSFGGGSNNIDENSATLNEIEDINITDQEQNIPVTGEQAHNRVIVGIGGQGVSSEASIGFTKIFPDNTVAPVGVLTNEGQIFIYEGPLQTSGLYFSNGNPPIGENTAGFIDASYLLNSTPVAVADLQETNTVPGEFGASVKVFGTEVLDNINLDENSSLEFSSNPLGYQIITVVCCRNNNSAGVSSGSTIQSSSQVGISTTLNQGQINTGSPIFPGGNLGLVGAIDQNGQNYIYYGPLRPDGRLFSGGSLPLLNSRGYYDSTIFLDPNADLPDQTSNRGDLKLTDGTVIPVYTLDFSNRQILLPNGQIIGSTSLQNGSSTGVSTTINASSGLHDTSGLTSGQQIEYYQNLDESDPLVISQIMQSDPGLSDMTATQKAEILNSVTSLDPSSQLQVQNQIVAYQNLGISDPLAIATLLKAHPDLQDADPLILAEALNNSIELGSSSEIEIANLLAAYQVLGVSDPLDLATLLKAHPDLQDADPLILAGALNNAVTLDPTSQLQIEQMLNAYQVLGINDALTAAELLIANPELANADPLILAEALNEAIDLEPPTELNMADLLEAYQTLGVSNPLDLAILLNSHPDLGESDPLFMANALVVALDLDPTTALTIGNLLEAFTELGVADPLEIAQLLSDTPGLVVPDPLTLGQLLADNAGLLTSDPLVLAQMLLAQSELLTASPLADGQILSPETNLGVGINPENAITLEDLVALIGAGDLNESSTLGDAPINIDPTILADLQALNDPIPFCESDSSGSGSGSGINEPEFITAPNPITPENSVTGADNNGNCVGSQSAVPSGGYHLFVKHGPAADYIGGGFTYTYAGQFAPDAYVSAFLPDATFEFGELYRMQLCVGTTNNSSSVTECSHTKQFYGAGNVNYTWTSVVNSKIQLHKMSHASGNSYIIEGFTMPLCTVDIPNPNYVPPTSTGQCLTLDGSIPLTQCLGIDINGDPQVSQSPQCLTLLQQLELGDTDYLYDVIELGDLLALQQCLLVELGDAENQDPVVFPNCFGSDADYVGGNILVEYRYGKEADFLSGDFLRVWYSTTSTAGETFSITRPIWGQDTSETYMHQLCLVPASNVSNVISCTESITFSGNASVSVSSPDLAVGHIQLDTFSTTGSFAASNGHFLPTCSDEPVVTTDDDDQCLTLLEDLGLSEPLDLSAQIEVVEGMTLAELQDLQDKLEIAQAIILANPDISPEGQLELLTTLGLIPDDLLLLNGELILGPNAQLKPPLLLECYDQFVVEFNVDVFINADGELEIIVNILSAIEGCLGLYPMQVLQHANTIGLTDPALIAEAMTLNDIESPNDLIEKLDLEDRLGLNDAFGLTCFNTVLSSGLSASQLDNVRDIVTSLLPSMNAAISAEDRLAVLESGIAPFGMFTVLGNDLQFTAFGNNLISGEVYPDFISDMYVNLTTSTNSSAVLQNFLSGPEFTELDNFLNTDCPSGLIASTLSLAPKHPGFHLGFDPTNLPGFNPQDFNIQFPTITNPISQGEDGIVNCFGFKDGEYECDFPKFMELLNRIIRWIIFYAASPLAGIMFAYAGYLYLTSAANPAQRTQAKDIFINVGLGYILILTAWLLVAFILSTLGVTGSFNLLQ